MDKTYALLAAAGTGSRLGAEIPKQYLPLAGKPVLSYSLSVFGHHPEIDGLIVVVGAGWEKKGRRLVEQARINKPAVVVTGGAERQESVYRGLLAVPEQAQLVLIHDAARPLVTEALISRVIKAARRTGAVVPGVPLKDTIKQIDEDCLVAKSLPRDRLVAVQTPQAFRHRLILKAHAKAAVDQFRATDDAMLVEQLGLPVETVLGDECNFKITTGLDLELARLLLIGDGNR